MSSYSVGSRAVSGITGDGEVPGGGGLMVAVRLEDLASPLRNGRMPGESDRSALVIGGTEKIGTGEKVVFLQVVAVAPAQVRRDGRVQAQGSPAVHATLGPLEEWLERQAGPGLIEQVAARAVLRKEFVKGERERLLTRAFMIRVIVLMTLMPDADGGGAVVGAGGGLLVILGPRDATEGWGAAWTALLGGAPGVPQQPEGTSGAGLVTLAFDHPIFEVFRAPGSGDFGSTRVYRYRRFRVDSTTGTAVLAQYDDGAPALVEHRVGSGKVLVWTSPFDNVWSDLPVQPVFLPLVHQMVRYLASFTRRPKALTVGALLDVARLRGALIAQLDRASDYGSEGWGFESL